MKINASYDTEDNTCEVMVDGEKVDNIVGLSISKYGEKYDCSVVASQMDGKLNKTSSWSCMAEKKKVVEAAVRQAFSGK